MVGVHEALSGLLSAGVRVIRHNACAVVPDLAFTGAHLGDSPIQPTHNTLSENIRAQSVELLNKHLAAAIDLYAQVKQAHWNVSGPSFIAIHELFDKVSSEVENYSDLIAARAGGLWGTAYGTVQVAAERSFLVSYPLGIADEQEHLFAISGTLAALGQSAREAIDQATTFGDADTADQFTENLARHRPSVMVRRIPHRPEEMNAAKYPWISPRPSDYGSKVTFCDSAFSASYRHWPGRTATRRNCMSASQ